MLLIQFYPVVSAEALRYSLISEDNEVEKIMNIRKNNS
jgi:hypothetical protein